MSPRPRKAEEGRRTLQPRRRTSAPYVSNARDPASGGPRSAADMACIRPASKSTGSPARAATAPTKRPAPVAGHPS
eukprot:14984917-Heterocapsa_arctica.AAC.1